jgi:hypothetical protein
MIRRITEVFKGYFLKQKRSRLFEERGKIEELIHTCEDAKRSILDYMCKSEWTQEDEDNIHTINEDLRELRAQLKKLNEEIELVLVDAA